MRRWASRFLATLGAALLLTFFTPLTSWWSMKLAGPWNNPRGEILLVPGADVQAAGVIGYSSYLRCRYAVMAWQEGGFERIVLTGGGTPQPVASLMRDLLVAWGVPSDRITLEERSTSTRENALFSAPLLAQWPNRRKVLLTSDQHMFRAIRAFRRAGVDCLPRPIPDGGKRSTTWTQRPSVLAGLIEESGKILYYGAKGWL